eukprot:CAMPEP_0201575598 /NCGR_PEP_ID=MMETSP0190_2-20130828/20903_1 /ASSEMBLY_ACC=CAM_ASM_000263 /TAXON_ID=37353 /ORGANISM="Rosalina sp." /LENGTH=240 /DNA_ID=CAMNT_0048005437 /DNA_START=90 /DNA_END=812 /DNA_ORIENTATION=+
MAEEKKQPGSDENMKEFARVGKEYNYRKQAIFFLNAYWADKDPCGEAEAEKVYGYVNLAGELDKKKGEEGNAMDEFESHRFLEKNGQTLTVVAMRQELKKIDIDTDNKMSLLEYCVYHYKLDIDTLMTRPQGVNEALEKAEAALEEVLAEIEKLEKKKAKLAKKAAKGGVKGKAAQNELEQIKASDPMPIRKALVTAQAALRKAQKSKDLNAMGKLWYIDREIQEAAKYKPKADWKRTEL